jgi:hypothetical protein
LVAQFDREIELRPIVQDHFGAFASGIGRREEEDARQLRRFS